ncbi:sodium-dependent transporter [Moraxella oblonga]|uniref:sodium-dependent transporter n=1 Tax=Moraxella oblonga TaxID=200413 RepID=UPI000832C218|nr:sodium-dependent transporter [Moraxella oblonga]
MSTQRETWSARSGFILAAVGSAVGLGNIWRFPYVAYENGGGAFFIPYLIALATAGFPLLFLDYVIGQKYKGAPPTAYRRMVKSSESIGWWHVAVCMAVGIFYGSVLSWAGSYMVFAFSQAWGSDPKDFFLNGFLHHSSEITLNFAPNLFTALIVVWALMFLIMFGGIKKGIELANKICIPLLVLMFGAMVARAVSLSGASMGIEAFFTPNWALMADPKVWLAAYGHIFFSMSIGFGIMVTYASYLNKNANLTGSGLVVGFANSSFELLAGIGIFSAIGFMAHTQGVGIKDVAAGGPGLAFMVFPKIISTMGEAGTIVGVLFFGSLFVAGVTSLASILQVPISACQDKFGWSKNKSVLIVSGFSAVVSIGLFSTNNALTFVDIIDHFTLNIGVVAGAIALLVWVTWVHRDILPKLTTHINHISSFKLGKGWAFMLTLVMPISLIITLGLSLIGLFKDGYEGYPVWLLTVLGGGFILAFALSAMIMPKIKGGQTHELDE